MIHRCLHLCSMSQKLTTWAKSMCGCCFNMYVKAPRTAFWHASSAKQPFFFGCCIQLGGIFRLSLLTWLTHYPSCWHRFECVYTCACDCVSVFLSIMFVMCSMPRYIKHQQLFLSLPVSIHSWLHVDILFLGLKHYYFFNITVYICFSVGFVYCYPLLTLAL